ncbi:hypothetical protein D1Y84_16420 [Acidipila sp. EB88]|nr:hypothetical protein D1Y84_16420 [Acidipila sp. EB88]
MVCPGRRKPRYAPTGGRHVRCAA